LSGVEVETLRAAAEARGFQATGRAYPPSYRDNDRAVVDDDDLAGWLFERIGRHLPARLQADDGSAWQLSGLNRRIRFCRYRDGQSFRIHRDGVHHASPSERSLLTFMVYLNSADEFAGGATRFFRGRDPACGEFMRVAPAKGLLITFDHGLWHDGAPVHEGTKWVMRSDIMYRRSDGGATGDSHLGYIWQLVQLRDGRLASCGRDGSLRLWQVADDPRTTLQPLKVVSGTEGSLTALAEARSGELWVGDRRGTIRVWRDGAWAESMREHDGAILALIRLPDGRIASGSADGTIGMWSPAGQLVGRLTGHDGWVWSLSARSDGVLVSGGEDGDVRLWSLATDREVGGYTAPGPVRAVLAGSDWRVWAGCMDGALVTWDGTRARVEAAAHAGAIRVLIELPDGRLATGGEDDRVRIWAGGELAEVACHQHDDFVTTLVPLADGRLASGGYDGAIRLWAT
jgi:WD40 repeat protein